MHLTHCMISPLLGKHQHKIIIVDVFIGNLYNSLLLFYGCYPVTVGKICHVRIKIQCLYIYGQTCLHLTFYPYSSSETYSCKYENMSNIVIHACKIILETMNLLQLCGPQITL